MSLSQLLSGEVPTARGEVEPATLARWLCHGGLPAVWDDDVDIARDLAVSYVDDIVHRDLASQAGSGRDPLRFRRFLTAYAGLTAQPSTLAALSKRLIETTGEGLNPETVVAYHDLATRMFLIEEQPAWSTTLRSKGSLAKMPKRHLADTSLVCALLGASPRRLIGEPTFMGHLFESQVTHDIRCYADSHRMRGVYHLRDSKGRNEIDAIIEDESGAWAGLEVKLGIGEVQAAAHNLARVAATVRRPPAALAVIVPSGQVTQLDDGVWVIPATTLGP